MKKLLALILCLSMLLSFAMILTSCGAPETPETPCSHRDADDNEACDNCGEPYTDGVDKAPDEGSNTVTYTVKFVDESGAPIKGLTIRFVQGDVASENLVTDNKGEAKIDLVESKDVRVELVSFDGWVEPASRKLTFGRMYDLEVELEEDTSFTLTATVVDENGDAVVGASIQLCVGSICLTASETNEDGEIYGKFGTEGKIKVKIVSLPDGYVMPSTIDDDGYHFYFAEGETDIEIVIVKQ